MAHLIAALRAASGSRFILLLLSYAFVLSAALILGYALRFDFAIPATVRAEMWVTLLWVVGIKLVFLYLFRQFSGLLTYFSIPDLQRILGALLLSSFIITIVYWTEGFPVAPSRGVIVADFLLSFLGICTLRLGFRMIGQGLLRPQMKERGKTRRIGIVGAGDVGAKLAQELMVKRGLGLKPVAFFDDDSSKWHSRVHGIPVIGALEEIAHQKENLALDKAIIAMPSASGKRMNEIVRFLREAGIDHETVPSLDQMATGKVRLTQIRPVEIQDLLGRDPVKLEADQISDLIQGKVVAVTGAGGSIGSELCRQIASCRPERLLLLEQSEVQMFLVEQELKELGHEQVMVPLVVDVLDRSRMVSIFKEYQPDVIFHAAAHKHVPLMESQPAEAIRNNVLGTAIVAELAQEFGAERFVLISTDKAINPTNVMGATKRLAEMFLQSFQAAHRGGTKFMAVRFGNVLGSSGSVIPTFKKQIAAGGPVKVTHPEVTRYFMTIPEAVGLVLQSATLGEGGEIFVLDMGESIKIVDLARQMVELSGLRAGEDIAIEFIGLRPGEKLYEELRYDSENMDRTKHPKVMCLQCEPLALAEVRRQLAQIQDRFHSTSANELKRMLQEIVAEYQPFFDEKESAKPLESPIPQQPVLATDR